jgi:transcriptional regulator with XRE-family HTH domain
MSATDLAKLLRVTPVAIWMWEKRGTMPRATTLEAMAEIFGVTQEFLLTGKKIDAEKHIDVPLVPAEQPLEELMRAIEAKGFHVSVRLKTE